MEPPGHTIEEARRLEVLRRLRILDTAPEEAFDRITRLASQLLGTPVALVSLVDDSRQWFKSRVGLGADQTPRDQAFCAHAIQGKEVMVVRDAADDARFRDNPLVTAAPHIRFYAGVPLVVDDHALGTLCVIDRKSRELSAADEAVLLDLAAMAEGELRLRMAVERSRNVREGLERSEELAQLGHFELDWASQTLRWSKQLHRMAGVDPDVFTPSLEAMRALFTEESRVRFEACLVPGERSSEEPMEIVAADGTSRLVKVTVRTEHDDNGDPLTLFGVLQDVTANVSSRLRLAHAEKMASIGTLAAGVAHEVNNPLTYIVYNADHLAEEVADMAGASPSGRLVELAEVVDEIRDGARRIHRIVKALKTFARSSSDRPRNVDLNRVVEIAVRLCTAETRERAEVVCHPTEEELPVLGDESQLVQVLVNLLMNAAQAIEQDGEPHEISITVDASVEGAATVEVRDDGAGMTAHVLARVFTPFFTTKPHGVGTGLGLAISHGIVTAHGGTLSLSSRVGHGTTARIELPRSTEVETLEPTSPRLTPPNEQAVLKVWVVDDDPIVGRSLVRALRPHNVTFIMDARDVLDRLAAGEEVDAIVCDLMMPNMDGQQLYERVCETHPASAKRFIFLTGGAYSPEMQLFVQELERPVLDKPVEAVALRDWIVRVSNGTAPTEGER